MPKLRVSKAARRDLKEIASYTLERWGDEQCERYLRQLDRCIRSLARSPTLGRACDEISAGLMKFHEGRHLIFYRRTSKTVDVVRVLHESMDVERRLKS